MYETFLIALRESFQCALLLALVLFYPPVRENRTFARSVTAGVLAAFLTGFPVGYAAPIAFLRIENAAWSFWRYVAESVVFYSGVAVLIGKPSTSSKAIIPALFVLGFLLFFFEARSLGYIVHDRGVMTEHAAGTLAAGLAGAFVGFLSLVPMRKLFAMAPLEEAFTAPSLLTVIGALQFALGGVRELDKENILLPLQRSLLDFLSGAVRGIQNVLLVPEHRFLAVDWTGLAGYLASDRIAISLAVIFLMTPPVFILVHLFSRPEPVVHDIDAGSRRRQKIAAFRKELAALTAPVLIAYAVLVVLLHAVNMSMNPLYDPAPAPVRGSGQESVLTIPINSKAGDLGDRKLRKFVYYRGSKEIVFIAVMKPDGSLGVALDQCEICRPADWNKDARGYAQRGEHIICKYCVTPIAANTVNTPGGCNPIPLPFTVAGNNIVIRTNDLVDIFDKAGAIERKGLHL